MTALLRHGLLALVATLVVTAAAPGIARAAQRPAEGALERSVAERISAEIARQWSGSKAKRREARMRDARSSASRAHRSTTVIRMIPPDAFACDEGVEHLEDAQAGGHLVGGSRVIWLLRFWVSGLERPVVEDLPENLAFRGVFRPPRSSARSMS